MFGVDIFNYGHEFFTRLKRKQNLKKMGKRIFGNEDDVVGRTSWFSGTKIKIRQSCLLSEYVGEGNTGAYDGELIIDMKTQSLFLLPEDLPGGDYILKSMYIPNDNYKITIITKTDNGTEKTYILTKAQNIGCFKSNIHDIVGEALDLENNEAIKSILIEDKNWVECFNQNRLENDDGSCGVCDKGYFENNNGECVPCAAANQIQLDDKTCGGCLTGYVVDEVEGSPTVGQCISEAPTDNTLLYVGGGLLGAGVLASILMGKK